MIIKSLGLQHPFFRPLIRRILTVAVIVIWGTIELSLGNAGWAIFAACIGAICVTAFFIIPDPKEHGDNNG